MAHQQQINVMADILHPAQLPKKSVEPWVKVFCEQHLEALKNINLAVNFVAPYIDEATNEQLANNIKCRRCNKYCPEVMYANLKHGEGKKSICCICSSDDCILPEIVTGIKNMTRRILLRKNVYTNRLTKYTCELCKITLTNSAKGSHEVSKQHTDNIKLKQEREERNMSHEETVDQYEDQLYKLQSDIAVLEEQVTDFEDKITEFEDKVVELEDNNADLKKQVKEVEQKVVERDDKIYMLETELDRAQNEADNFRSKYEQLLAQTNKPKVTRPYYRRYK